MNSNPFKVLTLDIETSPIDAFTWGLWQQNVIAGSGQLKEPQRILTWAAKWEHEDTVMWASEWDCGADDMVCSIYELIDEADMVIGYNHINYDMKHLNREFVERGLVPPTNYRNVDLLRVVKRMFKFPSNKLDYVASVLLGDNKLDTGGFGLWAGVMKGDRKAQKRMVEYNCEDVLLTERLYNYLQGWIPSHPNRGLWLEEGAEPVCPNCGSHNLVKKGIERPARVNAYQRYKCKDCGANSRGRTVVQKAGEGVLV